MRRHSWLNVSGLPSRAASSLLTRRGRGAVGPPHYWVLVAGALAGLTACAAQQEQQSTEEAQAELREISEITINQNFAENRVDPFEPYIGEEVSVFGPTGRELRVGKAPMMEGLRAGAAAKTTTKWEEWDWHIQVYGDIGIVSFLYDHEGSRAGQDYARTQRATYVFHRRAGRWQLVHDHTSALPPEPGT